MQTPVVQSSPQLVPSAAVTQEVPSHVWHWPQVPPQGSGSGQSPQSRVVLQFEVTSPHWSPQVVVTVQPQTPAVPPPPQVFGSAHPPQSRGVPQFVATLPHFPSQEVVTVQPHTFGVPPPPQLCGSEQLPQSTVVAQLVEMTPHLPSHVVVTVQPQTPAVPPPPQMSGARQVPQSSVWPQSSRSGPQFRPLDAQVTVATQVQTLGVSMPQAQPDGQSALVQQRPGSRQRPSQTICPVGQQSSSP
jgi:hypothetical protein